MDSKDIKSLLKDARESIKTKDFQLCKKLSLSILNEDAENYMALIFLGLSLQEVGPKDLVPDAFRKAININSTNVLAWNGLANYYEKLGGIDAQKELIAIYIMLLEIENNNKKITEVCEKIMSMIIPEERVVELVKTLQNITNSSDSRDTIETVWSTLAYIMSKLTELPSILEDIYKRALLYVLDVPKLVTKKYYNDYLKLHYKQNEYKEFFEEATKMYEIYGADTTALGWICKVYNELMIEDNNCNIYEHEKIKQMCDTLLSIQDDSSMGLFTKGVLLYEDNNFYDALELLSGVTNVRPGLLHAWVLLATCYLKLHLYSDALQAAVRADKLLISVSNSNIILRKKVDFLLLETLSRHGDEDNLHKAIEIGKTLDYEDVRIMNCLIRCHINLEFLSEAEILLSKLKENFDDKHGVILLTAQLFHKKGNVQYALKLLVESELDPSSEWWFEIALLHWDLQNFDQILVPLLKAAKLDQNCFTYFLFLGRYYKMCNNPDKARRCFEKTFKLNQKCIEAAIELTKLFRANKNWDANVKLLESITGDVPDVENEWAWIQLGLNYLAQGEYLHAIDVLRYVLRVNPNNSHCWESLGDAYMGRGAYTSALKSYQRALEISHDLLYPLLQIANIRRILGDYTEAKRNFEEILSTNKLYVPALKGLAETCILQARLYKKNYLFGSVRDYAQCAVDVLILCIKQCNDLSCLWKLAGDCCFLVASLPERYCCMLVLAALAEGELIEGNKILEKDQLYTLAERFYYKAATIGQDSASIWYDLGICFLSHAQSLHYNENSKVLYSKAANVAEYCIKLNPEKWQHWNLKALVAAISEQKNFALAQHSFIKAVLADDHSAIAWCNLGVLYLMLEDVNLANKAFSQSQRADPNFINCWIGQALIAESLTYNDDAMDLFRHSTQLGIHPESCIGYGQWVCSTLLKPPHNTNIYSIHNMHAVPVACDALTWYTDNNPENACAWNMLGILRERMGLKEGTTQAFRSALLLCDKEFRDKARMNFARSLFKQQKYKQAVDVYRDVQEATLNSGIGLALSLYKVHQHEESYETYEQALHWLTDDEILQADLLVALASIAYLFQGPDVAKTLLFQSTELKVSSPYGLYATLALGLLHKDSVLAKLVLKELHNRQTDPQCLPHCVLLLSYMCLLENDCRSAITEISRLIYYNPHSAFLWLALSQLLIRMYNGDASLIPAAFKASFRAAHLGLEGNNAIKVWCIMSMTSFLLKKYTEALKIAQRAVHNYPHLGEGWTVLMSAVVESGLKINNIQSKIMHLIKYYLNPSELLLNWLNRIS